jgi:hypothetical protein
MLVSMRLTVPALLLLCACATGRPEMGDRNTGPDFRDACPGPSWSSAVQGYDLASGPFVVAVEGVEARLGDRVVAVSHRTRFADGPVEAVLERSLDGGASFAPVGAQEVRCVSSNTGKNGELGPETKLCTGRKQIRLSYTVAGAPARFRLVLRPGSGGKAFTGRVRLQVVPVSCRALDVCWRASGNNCDGAPLSNCTEDEAGMLSCPTSVGSQAHDSCCSVWDARGYVCGRCGSAFNPLANLDECKITEPPENLPERLLHRSAGSFPGGYIPCRAEWDIAFRDVASLPERLWSFPFDPLDVTWRPREITRLTVVRGKPAAVPLEGVLRFPAGAHLRTVDAELGWCASGRWHETAPGTADCE